MAATNARPAGLSGALALIVAAAVLVPAAAQQPPQGRFRSAVNLLAAVEMQVKRRGHVVNDPPPIAPGAPLNALEWRIRHGPAVLLEQPTGEPREFRRRCHAVDPCPTCSDPSERVQVELRAPLRIRQVALRVLGSRELGCHRRKIGRAHV